MPEAFIFELAIVGLLLIASVAGLAAALRWLDATGEGLDVSRVRWGGLDVAGLFFFYIFTQVLGALLVLLAYRYAIHRFESEIASASPILRSWIEAGLFRFPETADGGWIHQLPLPITSLAALLVIAGLVRLRGGALTRPGGVTGPRALVVLAVLGVSIPVPLLIVGWLWELLLRVLGLGPQPQAVVQLFEDAVGGGEIAPIVTLAVAAVVVAPVMEEVIFRGLLYGWMRTRCGAAAATLATSVLFAAIHVNLVAALPVGLLSWILCHVYERRGRIVEPIFLHAVFNLLSLTALSLRVVGG